MCEILVRAIDGDPNPDPVKDLMRYKRGDFVLAKPDGWPWGSKEGLPSFVIIKVPMISVDRVQKYFAEWVGEDTLLQRRIWRLRWQDLPAAARNKLQNGGELTIKATDAYTGSYDYTWAQVKAYFRDRLNEVDETEDL